MILVRVYLAAFVLFLSTTTLALTTEEMMAHDQLAQNLMQNWLKLGEFFGQTPDGRQCLVSLRTNIMDPMTRAGMPNSLNLSIEERKTPRINIHATLLIADKLTPIIKYSTSQSENSFDLSLTYKNSDMALIHIEKMDNSTRVDLKTRETKASKKVNMNLSCIIN
ncbi:MAG: hypothetical protein AABY64_14240 [Bdellovibrionota bacterium]